MSELMNNLRLAQAAYDAMTPDDPLEYRDSQHYLDWVAMVTKEILKGCDDYGLCSFFVSEQNDPEQFVCENIDDSHYIKYCEAQRDYD